MINFSPSIVTFTKEKRVIPITVKTDSNEEILLKNITLVAIKRDITGVTERLCSDISFSTIGSFTRSENTTTITLKVTEQISKSLRECVIEKGESLALRIKVTPKSETKNLSVTGSFLAPIFDNSQGTIFDGNRTASVLGELNKQLVISDVVCAKEINFTRKDVTCQTNITNATNTGVVINVVSTIRDSLPPSITRYQNLERTNILLMPGESYGLSFVIPKTSYSLFKSVIGVSTTFSTTSNETLPFITTKETVIWYTPALLIGFTISLAVALSAILLRKKNIKFKS